MRKLDLHINADTQHRCFYTRHSKEMTRKLKWRIYFIYVGGEGVIVGVILFLSCIAINGHLAVQKGASTSTTRECVWIILIMAI